MRRIWRRLPEAALILTVGALACSGKGEAAAKAQQLPAGHPPVASSGARQSPAGIVLETMDAGGYTYVRLGAGMPGGEEIWAAGPVTKVAVGDTVIMVNPMSMSNFTSKTLNRTFDKIYFTDAFKAPGDVPAAAPSSGAPSVSQGVVQETMDSGGYTYIQVKAGDASVWLAAPQTPVEKGATISWDGAMPMRQFTSKTLNRTFDEILFVGGIKVVSGS